MRSAFSNPLLWAFPLTKLSPRWLVGKNYLSSFWNILNFWIWMSFAPSKVESPKTTSYVSKKYHRRFLAFRWPRSTPKLMEFFGFSCFLMINPKIQTIPSKYAPVKSAVPVALCTYWVFLCFQFQNLKIVKFSQNCPKIGTRHPQSLLWWDNEASSRIYNLFFSFWLLKAFLNLANSWWDFTLSTISQKVKHHWCLKQEIVNG